MGRSALALWPDYKRAAGPMAVAGALIHSIQIAIRRDIPLQPGLQTLGSDTRHWGACTDPRFGRTAMKTSLLVLLLVTGLRPAAEAAPAGFAPWSIDEHPREESVARVHVPRAGFAPWHEPGRGPIDETVEVRPALAVRAHGFSPWLKPDV
jgi:hypothetical protein